jgi:hypothetical protein
MDTRRPIAFLQQFPTRKTVTMMAERLQHVNDFTASHVDFFTYKV